MKSFVIAFSLIFVSVWPSAAQDPPSLSDYLLRIQNCDAPAISQKLSVSCEELVQSFNKAFPTAEGVVDKASLITHIRNSVPVPCPVNYRTRVGRLVGQRVDLSSNRELGVGEFCLYDRGEGHYVSTMWPGQWLPDTTLPKPQTFMLGTSGTATPPAATSTPSSQERVREAVRTETPVGDAVRQVAETTPVATSGPAAYTPPSKRHFLSLKRRSGKITWVSLAAAAAGGTVYAVKHPRIITQEVIIYR